MELMCSFEVHEYMDFYPEINVVTFVGENENDIELKAKDFAKKMMTNYSGGTTKFLQVMSKEDAKAYIDNLVENEKKNWHSDSEEFIEKITKIFNRCYEN